MSGEDRPSKTIIPVVPVVESVPWWMSQQMRVATLGAGGAIAGIIHAVCVLWGLCLFKNIEVTEQAKEIAALIGGVVSLAAFIYWMVKRVAVGKDPTNTAAPLTLK